MDMDDNGIDDLEDDDDEETLQLKLQAIQARLKLKKLQAKKKAAGPSADADNSNQPRRRLEDAPPMRPMGVPLQSGIAAAREKFDRAQSEAIAVQVPASPVRKARPQMEQTSPQRVLLGIDKGIRASDVSLKRAPSMRKLGQDANLPQGGYLKRARTPVLSEAQKQDAAQRPMSFNDRLAAARTEEAQRKERLERIERVRTTAFSVGQTEMEQYKTKAVEIPDIPLKPEEFSRDDILRTANKAAVISGVPAKVPEPPPQPSSAPKPSSETESGSIEPYSGFHLSKRILPHQVLARTLSGKQTYQLKDLLRDVKAPDFSLPDIESDIVIFAIIGAKSDPRSHAPRPGASNNGKQPSERGKYMVMTLVDLSYELELFLFDTGFARFWKMTPGTVVAILNPGVMPPPPGREATGRFSLVINSDADTILEIGHSRDLGFCKSIKADGATCGSWINAKRTEYCEFHTNAAVSKVRSGRNELNSSGFGPSGNGGGGMRNKWAKKKHDLEEEKKRVTYDRNTHSAFFVSSAALVDGDGSITDRVEREEGLKRKMLQQERERDIAKKLGEIGGGAGKEYMSRRVADNAQEEQNVKRRRDGQQAGLTTSSLPGEKPPRPDARALGLVAPKGEQPRVDLSRAVKRKRPDSALSGTSSTTGTSTLTTGGDLVAGRLALGWGTSLSTKLARMKDGEKLDGSTSHGENIQRAFARVEAAKERTSSTSPVRKKTRFVTEKGIREAGRESLGEPLTAKAAAAAAARIRGRQVVLDDDDDDDLIIVK